MNPFFLERFLKEFRWRLEGRERPEESVVLPHSQA